MIAFEIVRRHAKAIAFCVAALAGLGTYLAFNLPVSLFPDITFPRIVILADNGEQPPERMMIEVTKPLEEVASSIPGIRMVRSITGRGSSEISLGLNWGVDVPQTLQLLQGRIAAIRNELPATASTHSEQMSVAVFPILGYSLTSDSLSQVALRDIAYYQIRPAIMRVDGVSQVEVAGGDTREFHVTVDPRKLAGYRVDIRQLQEALLKSNLILATGLTDNNYQLYLSLVSGLLNSIDDVSRLVVTVRNGVPIHISDLALVTPSVAPTYVRTTASGRPAVLINVIKQPTGSTVRIGEEVKKTVSGLALPAHLHFENWYDQGDFIRSSIASTRDAILVGILLSMLVLVVFLRNGRITLVMLIVVPVTVAVTIVCLKALGQSINIMTLGGLAAAVGLIIDDSIVVIERVFAQASMAVSHPDGGKARMSTVIAHSLRSILPSQVGSTLSTMVINVPLLFLGGVVGAFFAPLAITMIFALLTSFLFSIILTPLLQLAVWREGSPPRHRSSPGRLSQWYGHGLARLLRFRFAVIPAAIAVFALTFFIYANTGTGFMPDMDEGTFVLDYTSPPGSSLDETDRMLGEVEKILVEIPEVDSYSRRTGIQLGFFLTEPNTGDFLVKLKNKRNRSIEKVIAELRSRVEATEPALQIDFGQLMMDVIGDLTNNPKPVEIKLFGADTKILEQKAREVAALIERVPGVVDVFDGIVISGPSMIVHVDAAKAALAGLTVEDVQEQLEMIMNGRALSRIQRGERLVAIRIRYPESYRRDVHLLERVQLLSSPGSLVPLMNIAEIEMTEGQAEIGREGLRQLVAVTARIEGRDLGHTIADVQARLKRALVLPRGMTVEYGGVYQTQQESFRGLLLVALAAFTLVFIVLLFEFGEFAAPVSILTVSLLSLLGVVSALWITGVTFNISSFVGLIMIIGIVAENGVFVVNEIQQRRASGIPLDTAIVEAGQMRARPIIMTTLAAILALLPLALGLGAGAQMQQPLAIAVIGGFCVSSVLLFFALPLLYRILRRS